MKFLANGKILAGAITGKASGAGNFEAD